MKKKPFIIGLFAIWLIFNLSTATMAQFGQAYFESKKYEGTREYYAPKIGSYWGIENKCLVFWGHNLSGYDDSYLGANYTFFKKINIEAKYENNEDEESTSFKISRNYALNKAWSLYGEISNIRYSSKVWHDYEELKGYCSLQWQITSDFNVSASMYLTQKEVDYAATNYDSHTFGQTVGFWDRVAQPLSIWGNYRFSDLNYQDQMIDDAQNEKNGAFSVGATYILTKKYSIYLSYDSDIDKTIANLSATKTKTTIFGLSYNFY